MLINNIILIASLLLVSISVFFQVKFTEGELTMNITDVKVANSEKLIKTSIK